MKKLKMKNGAEAKNNGEAHLFFASAPLFSAS